MLGEMANPKMIEAMIASIKVEENIAKFLAEIKQKWTTEKEKTKTKIDKMLDEMEKALNQTADKAKDKKKDNSKPNPKRFKISLSKK